MGWSAPAGVICVLVVAHLARAQEPATVRERVWAATVSQALGAPTPLEPRKSAVEGGVRLLVTHEAVNVLRERHASGEAALQRGRALMARSNGIFEVRGSQLVMITGASASDARRLLDSAWDVLPGGDAPRTAWGEASGRRPGAARPDLTGTWVVHDAALGPPPEEPTESVVFSNRRASDERHDTYDVVFVTAQGTVRATATFDGQTLRTELVSVEPRATSATPPDAVSARGITDVLRRPDGETRRERPTRPARRDRAREDERAPTGRYDIVDFGRELRFVGGEPTPLGADPVRSFFRRVVPTAAPPPE